MRHGRFWPVLPLLFLAACLAAPPRGPRNAAAAPEGAPAKGAEEPSAEEEKEKLIAERFQQVLEANPRRGTALDRLYGYHVERGSLDRFVDGYKAKARQGEGDGNAWMIVGLLESQRGKDAAAVAAFGSAEKLLPENPMAPYYLGQSLVLVGQPDAAAEAFERALTRKPNRNDLLDIFQSLGRVYQRAQRTEKALAVWARLQKLFPDDPRVQDQIATTLTEEGQYDQALPRLEKLARQTEDPYRKATLQMEAAELKVRLRRTPEALQDFERLIGELNPDSWLYREVRRRVEDVFLRNDDQAGLAKYYEGWVAKNPNDVESVARLAKALSNQGRLPEARKWLEKGLEVAPTNKGLRQALIDQLVYEQKFGEAAAQYEALDKNDPNNPDILREWGKVLLRDGSRPEDERKAAAVAVWKRLLTKRPKDPLAASQVADLVRSAGRSEEAIELYKRAVELAPDAAQYREYLGEFYHTLKRPGEALATWRPIAEGANRNPKNLSRLAEVLAGFGYKKEAAAALSDAVELEKDDINLRLAYAKLLEELGRHDDALAQLDAAARLAGNAEESEAVLSAQVGVYQSTDTLETRTETLRQELEAGKDATADRWHRLARYCEAARQTDRATAAIKKAIEKDPKSIPVLASAARIHEEGGNLQAAADTYRKLAALDRRFRTEHLTNVAKLESKLGRREQALQAGRDLLAAAPGNPDHYKFFADLCFQLGDAEEGLESLRRSVRANPSEPQGLLTLAAALSDRQRSGEAVELLWRAFEKTTELEGKLSIIGSLTDLYLQQNQFDKLLERLERERKEAEKAREMTLCIAQAYQSAGDFGTARQQLERLLTENTRDTALLGQLSQLAEAESDFASAIKYQRQFEKAAPNNREGQTRLAQLLTRTGDSQEAADTWLKLVAGHSDMSQNLQTIDSLFTADKVDIVLAVTSRLLAQKPGEWELLYREGCALAHSGKTADAARRFRALLALRLPDDEPGAAQKAKIKPTTKKPVGMAANRVAPTAFDTPQVPLALRTQRVWELRGATGLEANYYYGGNTPFFAPSDFGQARMASLAWLLTGAMKDGTADALVKQYRDAASRPNAGARARWDWYYVQYVRQDMKSVFEIARELARTGEPAAEFALLASLSQRTFGSGPRYYRGNNPDRDTTPALPADQLEQVLACYRGLRKQKPDWLGMAIVDGVLKELKRARRSEEENQIYRECVAAAGTPRAALEALRVAAERGEVDTALTLFQKIEKLQGPAKSTPGLLPTRQAADPLAMVIGKRASAKAYGDVTRILDTYLAHQRRINQQSGKPPGASRSGSQAYQTNIRVYQAGNANGRYVYLDFPTPNEYFDAGALTLLRNAYESFKRADLLSDLVAHFRKQAEAAPAEEKVYHLLATGYLHWWNNEKDEALDRLTAAARAAPADQHMLMDVAELREKNNEPQAALALLDAVTPLDHQAMQRRERLALRLAERTGNVGRAREAAERLFGLRLDAETQVELAGKMHRLSMHAMAETVLTRASRQAGSRTNALVSLMNQYRDSNQPELAVQIARQLLRKTPVGTYDPYRGYNESDNVRQQAVDTLSRSGKLADMIARAEQQLKASPKAVQVHQSLLDLYKAAGDKEKFKATVQKITELKPEDGKLRYYFAQQLQQTGDRDGAIEQYVAGIRKEPRLLANRYWEIFQLFQQANKMELLYKAFEDIDPRSMGNYWIAAEVAQPLLADEKTRPLGLKLFKKNWEAFPEYRTWLIGNISYDDRMWEVPEIYDFARQAVLPREDGPVDPWASAEDAIRYHGDGRVDGIVTQLMRAARTQSRDVQLRAEVEAALERHPDWCTGKAILAIYDLQAGNTAAARKRWQELLADSKNPMPHMARYVLGQELANYGGMEDLHLQTLEGAVEDTLGAGRVQFAYSPLNSLVRLYDKLGRKDEARALALRSLRQGESEYDPGYNAYLRIQNAQMVATFLRESGDPVESVRICNELLADREAMAAYSRFYGGGDSDEQIEQHLRAAVRALTPETLPAAVRSLLTPRAEGPTAGRTGVDVILMIEPRELTRARLNSVLEIVLRSAAKSPELRAQTAERLSRLLAEHPADLSAHVAAALAAADNPDAFNAAVNRLVEVVEATPLEELPAGARANARHRAEAMTQIPLWLVARQCLSRKDLYGAGAKLAARSVQAARRQLEPLYASAILREWGQLELDRGDRKAAEARWTELLELVLPPAVKPTTPATTGQPAPGTPAAAPSATQGRLDSPEPTRTGSSFRGWLGATVAVVAVAQVPPPVPPVPATGPVGPASRSVVTNVQFARAVQVARLAAERQMTGLSLRAVREALVGGPPVDVPDPNMRRRVRWVSTSNGTVQQVVDGDGATSVDAGVNDLVGTWRKLKVSPGELYDLLAAIVLPDARPAEVFLYAGNVNYSELSVRSVGWLLTDLARESGKTDDLRRRLEARKKQPLGELPARVLLTRLSFQAKDPSESQQLLRELAERLEKDTGQTTADQVLPVLGEAIERPELAAVAVAGLGKAARNLAANKLYQQATDVYCRLARHELVAGKQEAARQAFREVEDIGKKASLQQGDQFRLQQANRLAEEYLRANWVEDALGQLARYVDGQPAPQRTDQPRDAVWWYGMPSLARRLLEMPAARRYELLKAWTFPGDAKVVRVLAGTGPTDVPPAAFGAFAVPSGAEALSSLTLLAGAAREAGNLDDLAAAADKRVADKINLAVEVRRILRLASDRGAGLESDLVWYTKDLRERSTKEVSNAGQRYYYNQEQGRPPVRALDYLLAHACLAEPKTAAAGERMLAILLDQARSKFDGNYNYLIRRDLARSQAARAAAPAALAADGGLVRWHSAGSGSGWAARDGLVGHLFGSQPGLLVYDTPLAGTFEFSVDAYQGGWAEGHVGYGGYVFESNRPGVNSSVWSVGGRDTVGVPNVPIRDEAFNRFTVRVEPGKVTCFVNGQLYHEDTEPGGTSPWIMLATQPGRGPVWRNFALSGTPVVPREVKLTHGNSLDGWVPHVYGNSLSTRMLKKQQEKQTDAAFSGNGMTFVTHFTPPVDTDWEARDGEIHGRKLDAPGRAPAPSALAYFRPVRNGEKVRYEFFHEADGVHVHPFLGRLAFLLEPAGVRLHWLTDSPTGDWTGLTGDNAVHEPDCQRGPKELPLKVGDWNTLAMEVTDNRVKLELNGTLVYERKLEPSAGRQFGLFHYRDRSAARVRNVVLTGNWPEKPKGLDEPFATRAASPAEARVRRSLIGERFFGLGAGLVLEKTRELAPAERYRLLADWVLPTEDRPYLQLAGEWTPQDVAPPVFRGPLPEGTRVVLGSRFEAPALELVRLAKELNRLDELAGRVESFKPVAGDVDGPRARAALLAAVRAAQGKEAEAGKLLEQLASAAQVLSAEAPIWRRWPDFVAARATVPVPGVRPKALALLDVLVERLQEHWDGKQPPFVGKDDWLRQVRLLRGQAQVLSLPGEARPFGSDPGLAYWSPVLQMHTSTRGHGNAPAHWEVEGKVVRHFQGHGDDYLCLRTPLRGDFTVECELTSFGWRESHVAYGGLRFDLNWDKKSFWLHRLDRGGPLKPIDPPVEVGDWYPFKLEVNGSTMTVYVAGRKITEAGLGTNPDPWLMLHARFDCTAGIRNLRITGNPTVPDVVDLSTGPEPRGWRGYSGGTFEKRGDELYSNGSNLLKQQRAAGQSDPKRTWSESAVFYHRPLLEDDVVEYEFYYDPESCHAHPALDRLVFLLEPAGVRVHWLTDGTNESTALKPDNVADEPDNRRGSGKLPLKDKAWNRVRLTLKGDTVSLNLNGQDVYERKVESTNQRTFGLFHYADAGELRARNVTLRGDWPKRLPAAEELFKTK